MKTNSIKPILTRGAIWTAIIAGWATASYSTYQNVEKEVAKKQIAQNFLRAKAPQKYIQLAGEDLFGSSRWVEAAEQAKDSIKLDSIAKTNYAIGIQAANDSLAKINKK